MQYGYGNYAAAPAYSNSGAYAAWGASGTAAAGGAWPDASQYPQYHHVVTTTTTVVHHEMHPLSGGAIAGIVVGAIVLLAGIAMGVFYSIANNPCGGTPSVEQFSQAMVAQAESCPQGLNMTKVKDPTVAKTVMNLMQERADITCPELLSSAATYVRLCSDRGYMDACTDAGNPQNKKTLQMTGTLDGCALRQVPVYIYAKSGNANGRVYDGVPCILIRDNLDNGASDERRINKQKPFGPNEPTNTCGSS